MSDKTWRRLNLSVSVSNTNVCERVFGQILLLHCFSWDNMLLFYELLWHVNFPSLSHLIIHEHYLTFLCTSGAICAMHHVGFNLTNPGASRQNILLKDLCSGALFGIQSVPYLDRLIIVFIIDLSANSWLKYWFEYGERCLSRSCSKCLCCPT